MSAKRSNNPTLQPAAPRPGQIFQNQIRDHCQMAVVVLPWSPGCVRPDFIHGRAPVQLLGVRRAPISEKLQAWIRESMIRLVLECGALFLSIVRIQHHGILHIIQADSNSCSLRIAANDAEEY